MSRVKSQRANGFEGYIRCSQCDYCELSHASFEPSKIILEAGLSEGGSNFFYHKDLDEYWCQNCEETYNSIMNDYYHENEEDIHVGKFVFKRNPEGNITNPRGRTPSKVTLPGITGVNEGPKIDLDKDEK